MQKKATIAATYAAVPRHSPASWISPELQERLGREINAKVFAVSEWNAKVKAKSAFTTDVTRKPKIFLAGDEDELRGLGRKEPRSRRAGR
jgi:hypothetical protein